MRLEIYTDIEMMYPAPKYSTTTFKISLKK